MAGFDDRAAPALHDLDPVLDAGGDDADQRAGDQDAEERDEQGQEPPSPTDVARHRPRVERPQRALPEVLEPRAVLGCRRAAR